MTQPHHDFQHDAAAQNHIAHTPSPILDAALEYADRGWRVFPAPPGEKKSHKSAEHSGGRAWGSTTDAAEIRRDFSRWSHANVGIVTGAASGLFVVDVDVPGDQHSADGLAAWAALIQAHGDIPNTIEASSPTGGRHVYFRWPSGEEITNSTGRVAPGIDVRGEGGMTLGVPSVRTKGGVYAWRNPPGLFDLADCPEWLLALCRKRPRIHIDTGAGSYGGDTRPAGPEEVAEALTWIDPDLPYQDWLTLLMALHDAFGDGGISLAEEWSARGSKYASGLVAEKWRGFSAGGGATLNTVFHHARQAGCDVGALARKHRFQDRGSARADGGGGPRDSGPKQEQQGAQSDEPTIVATPFVWTDPRSISPRPWLYGRHLLRGQVSVTVGPGGVSKSSLVICEGLAMASGRKLLGEWVAGQLRVWLFNLEDPRDELQRRITAAMLHHGLTPEDIGDRLFVDSGRERGLCTAIQTKNGVQILRPEMDTMEAEIKRRRIDALSVDPFVSSHRVQENDNGAIDLVAKEWAKLAERCNCAIELVHHTRKLNGEEGSSESGRGAVALLAAARSGRVLNRMGDDLRKDAGIPDSDVSTYFSITRDKANLAPTSKRTWCRTATVDLWQGDLVGVVETWEWPDAFDGVHLRDLLAVQRAIAKRWEDSQPPRFSSQAGDDWVGHIVAAVLALNADQDKKRIGKLISEWLKKGALRKVDVTDATRRVRPCIEVGEWATE